MNEVREIRIKNRALKSREKNNQFGFNFLSVCHTIVVTLGCFDPKPF